ncbi:2-oxoacid:ferredoxin oxidoreductase subunit beta [Alicyclobacillus tolerans]|uniref:2-oxoacid:ferredoxin oxidoreductase subunit beta n=1 Tax=Alicyclobacillus tolerans TaxID=90970 RepID=UPI001F257D81|nr:2-oxoacid:ferredoxin oxidoreductase subunit beta [Alicyclobacillus tolerans]MCF8567455.1 2-oxoacid:ferredoxin oxidoreductase subunit beta [Alicyclobacillus tolerans]
MSITVDVTVRDYENGVRPNWCPGCGDFSVLNAIVRAAVQLHIPPEEFVLVSGVGCSGRISGYLNTYGIQGVHGRALPLAQGIKLGNKNLNVVVAGGDGDGLGIGLGHFIHSVRRNVDLTYLVMDNQIYGLTKGQTSPTSPQGFQTKSTPDGNPESPIHPLQMALNAGASFVAQGFSGNPKQLVSLLTQAMEHPGFSFINVYSPCVTFNKVFTYEFFKEHLTDTQSVPNYDITNFAEARKFAEQTNYLCTGVIFKQPSNPYPDTVQRADSSGFEELSLDHVAFENFCDNYR